MNNTIDAVSVHSVAQRVLLVLILSFFVSIANGEQVVDEDTGKPLEGVFVMVRWTASAANPVISQTVCYAFETLRTDKNGKFDAQFSWNFNPFLRDRQRSVGLYLAGYERSPNDPHDGHVAVMRRFKGSSDDRLKYLLDRRSIGRDCVSPRENKEKLGPFYKAMYEEATQISTSIEDAPKINELKLHWESSVLPFDKEHRYSGGTPKPQN